MIKIRDTITPSLEKLQRRMADRRPILLAMLHLVSSSSVHADRKVP